MSPRPMLFSDFCARVLSVQLTPGQRVIARVAYDGVDPCELSGGERDIARGVFGHVERIPPEARHVVAIVAGARGGKSYVLSALRLLHLALTVPLTTLAPGETAVGVCVAPTLKLAQQVLGYIRGAIEQCPSVAQYVVSQTTESIVIARPDGPRVSLECLAAGARGAALRGRSLVGVAMDEAAMFRDPETGAINDEEVFRAVAPRVVKGGVIIIASTPWAEAGLLHALYKANHGKPTTALVAHAPTLVLRDDEHTRSYVAREEQRDPTNAAREFGARFLAGDALAFFDPRAITSAVDEKLRLPLAWDRSAVIAVAADFGFVRDSSAQVVVQRVADSYTVADIAELVPGAAPLQPSHVVRDFAERAGRFGASAVTADAHYRQSIHEHLLAHKLRLYHAPEGQIGKAETYSLARTLLHEGRVKLPNHERLLRQLREVTGRPTPGGALSIQSPRWKTGGHGDLVSALVLALWDASRQRYIAPPLEPEYGSHEWHERENERRIAAKLERMARADLPWWKRDDAR